MSDRKAFVTGSRKYGTPKSTSDIDLVVMISEGDLDILVNVSDNKRDIENYGICHGSYNVKFKNLNLLCCTDEVAYDVWKEGTKKLRRMKPVDRATAVKTFIELRKKNGLLK